MMKLYSFLKPYRFHMAFAFSLMLVELAVELWQPLLMARIIDDGIVKKDLGLVLELGGLMLGLSVLAFASGITNSFFAAHASQNFGFDVRNSMLEKILSFSFTNLTQFSTSSLITRMTNDVNQLQNTLFMSLRIAMRAPLLVIGGIVMAFFVNIKLALIFAAVIPVLLIFLLWIMNKAALLFEVVQGKLDRVNAVIRENLAGMRLIKAFARGTHEETRFEKANETLMATTAFTLRLTETTIPVLLLFMNFSILILLWFGHFEVNTGEMKVGEVVAIVNYATRITSAFSMFSFIIIVFSRAKASKSRIEDVLITEVDLRDARDIDGKAEVKDGKIEFKRVTFGYPGAGAPVLQEISFTAEPGETVALMGATGAGKSTLFHLIPWLYDTSSGEILIDGKNIRLFKLENLRRQVGLVPQEALLFTGTVQENIGWGKEDASDIELIEAAQGAQIHDTIEKFPLKYETLIGQKGVNLSGGQKQRMSIARALVRRPKILLLDDSTSALDIKTEAKLLSALKHYKSTTLIITQKISTAMAADKILLLEDGKLHQEGSHELLLRKSSLYRQIYQSQLGEVEVK
ncbi:ABC transporter ATP-binding protein [Bacillus sp. T33-2]|uniref:ABC transporter ATP-binding protein n=1 Tax=Bacillus sp. T33-2 TaxID=2054168 RepID=UPI000C77638D|nr:ABC transporter ATP-binding protein [Bacillus sp. T33-2]PLR95418.1 ABC transporter ATP-binding protein [Bacillus sp. T33-2]